MECLTPKADPLDGIVRHVPTLTYQAVPAQLSLNADLVATAGAQAHFEKRSPLELFEHAVVADRLYPARIACVRLFLNERFGIPDEVIAPRTLRRFYPAVHDGVIDAFWLPPLELILQSALCDRILREYHQSGGVLVYPMDDIGSPLAVRPEAAGDQVVDRRDGALALERHRQKARWFVDDNQHVVFIDDVEPVSLTLPVGAPGGARAVGPEPDDIPG